MTGVTDLAGWPQTPNWKDGIIDGIVTIGTGIVSAYLIRKGEILAIDPRDKTTSGGPRPFDVGLFADPNALPASWATSIDTGTRIASGASVVDWIFKGTAVAVVTHHFAAGNDAAQILYLSSLGANWPATWYPVLRHAPNGRDGNLWSVLPSERGS